MAVQCIRKKTNYKHMKKYYSLLFLAVALVLSSCNQAADEISYENDPSIFENAQGRMTPEMMWSFGRLSDMQISPDQKSILYGVKKYNLKANKGKNSLYTMSIDGSSEIQITHTDGSVWNGLWHPTKNIIGYIYADENGAQLWEANPDGSDAKRRSNIEGGITGFKYSPDGNSLMFTKDVKLDNTATEKHEDLPEAKARIIDELMYRHWSEWHDYKYSHIFIANMDDGILGDESTKDLMEGERHDCPMKPWGGLEQISWSPDSKKIAYACKKMTGKEYATRTNSEIYIYTIESNETTCLTKEGFDGYDHDPVFSHSGNMIAWKSMEEDGFEADKERIILHDFETTETIDLSEGFDQNSSQFVFSENDDYIYFISGVNATYQVYSMQIATREIKQITTGWHNYQSFALAGDQIIGTKMSMSMPTEIFAIDQKGLETQLSHVNDWILDEIEMGKVEERWIETSDGKQMLTWVIYPPGFDSTKQYPALLYCQGGPQSAVSQFFSYRWNFQIMASHDYIIVAPNRRGLPTFGQEWNDQISGDYGGQNMLDYFSAIDALKKESYIDDQRLGALGASYGGYSVFWLAGHHEGRFKSFISHCGIYNFESMYGSTEEYFFVNKDYEGAYWEDPKPKSYEFSPHLAIDKWDTPILIVTGEHDYRIPYTQSLEAFNAAQLRGVESKLLFFPEETHFVLAPQSAVLWQREFFEWLDKDLKIVE
mgnify:FL=1